MADKQPETRLEGRPQTFEMPQKSAGHDKAADLVPEIPHIAGQTGANERVGGPAPTLPDAEAAKARKKRMLIGAAAGAVVLAVAVYFLLPGSQPEPAAAPETSAAPAARKPAAAASKKATTPLGAAKALAAAAGDDNETEPGTKKKGRTDQAVDGFNTVLRAAEGKRDAPPPEKLTPREQAAKKEIAALEKQPKAKPATPAEHPLFSAKRGDWATYKSSKGGTQKRTVQVRGDTYAQVLLEPGEDVEVLFTKFYDPTFTNPMDVKHKADLYIYKTAEGDELLKLGDKPYLTHWTEYKVVNWFNTDINYLKTWMSPRVPLALVKAEHDFNTDPNLSKEERVKQRETVELVDYGGEAKATAAANPPPRADTKPPDPPPPPEKAVKGAEAPKAPPATADAGAKPATTPPPPPQAKKMEKVYVLKDGRRIRALSAMLADDTYLIKDTSGKTQSVAKTDVVEVTQQEAVAEPPSTVAEPPPPKETPQPKKAAEPPAVSAVQPATKDAPPPKKAATRTYVMKDGSRIAAVTVMEMENQLAIKDSGGKLTVVNKADVQEIVPDGK